jgi:hypothetical protein
MGGFLLTGSSILDAAFLHVDQIPADVDLVAEIQTKNAQGLEVPWVWEVSVGSDDPHDPQGAALAIGVFNEHGALNWVTNSANLVPSNGQNTDWVRYHLAGIHDTYLPPAAEVPIDVVYQVLAEFISTRALPTCVIWQEAQTST